MRKSIKILIVGLLTLIVGIIVIWLMMGDSFSTKEQDEYIEEFVEGTTLIDKKRMEDMASISLQREIILLGNDEVCLNSESIAKITLYDMQGKILSNSDTQKCFSVKDAREKGYRFEIKNKNGENLIIQNKDKNRNDIN